MPVDSYGNICGSQTTTNSIDLSARPYLYYFNIADPTAYPSICISQCPNTTTQVQPSNAICIYGYTPSISTIVSDVTNSKCAALNLESKPVLNRCVPTDSSLDSSMISKAVGQLSNIIHDLVTTWPVLVSAIFVAMGISFLWVFVMRVFAKPVVWGTLILVNLVLLGLSGFCYWVYKNQNDYFYASTEVGHNFDNVKWVVMGSEVGAILFGILFVVMLLVTIALRNKIRIACEIIEETSHAVAIMPFLMILPFFFWIIIALLLTYGVYILLYALTIDQPLTITGFVNINITSSNTARYMAVYHIFGILWTYSFLQAINTLIIAGSFATYYWTLDKRAMRAMPVTRSFQRAVTYHLGSAALGSLVISIIQLLRFTLFLARRSAKKYKMKVVSSIVGCFMYCMSAIEKLVKLINRNAYVKIAINGESFCKSCVSAMGLIVRNGLKLIAVGFDSERNDGSLEKPYYMTEALQRLIRVSNKDMQIEQRKKSRAVSPTAEF
ncbi:hypothetical protein HDU76_009343 [Blyttiomyces sp. JEL0837]|nr:hypothetical protein HDU76_009343 [Blyttiomyces sp. JEL0837]